MLKKILILLFLCFVHAETVQENHFIQGVYMLPHPDKVYKNGEDAYFVNKNILAVADGVGGWNNQGIDPGLYSKLLVKNVEKYVLQDEDKYIMNPKQLLTLAGLDTQILGSSTLAITTLDKKLPIIYSSYIGDCGYAIYRPTGDNNLQTLFVSEEQQKRFNFPYQLGMKEYGDSGDLALVFKHQIQDLDIIVNGSDGLFDNLDADQIKNIIQKQMDGKLLLDASDLSAQLAYASQKLAFDTKYISPFAKRAVQQGLRFIGGKLDDITVVVAQIKIHTNKINQEL